MSATPTRATIPEEPKPQIEDSAEAKAGLKKYSIAAKLSRYGALGAAAALLLSLVELVDLQYRLTPVLQTFSDRLIFSVYLSLNLLGGMLIGTVIGICALTAAFCHKLCKKLLIRLEVKRAGVIAYLSVSVLATILLIQLPPVYRYVLGLMIEAQKLPFMYGRLLENRVVVSHLFLFALVIACSLIRHLTRNATAMSRLLQGVWISGLILVAAAAYHIDSRIEVQLYGNSLHRSMFMLGMAATMALIATGFLLSPRFRLSNKPGLYSKKLKAGALALLTVMVVFTFYHFGKNQNLKVQIFTRTTQAKHHFNLAQWLLDFDRDGYSSNLGGGDVNDRNRLINPAQLEKIADGVDNNGIGGDLSYKALKKWKLKRARLNAATNPAPERFNIIYFFIDALRADHLSTYGYKRKTSPNIDRLASRASVFENAFSPSANTFEAVPKFMQSSYWDAHLETWTEVLARNGYKGLLFPAYRLPMLQRYVKGVEAVQEARGADAQRTIAIAIRILSGHPQDQPFLAYIYCPEPHSPYKKHRGFNFGSSLVDRYDGEIAYADHQIGKLLDWMESSGRINDTIVVIMSDHGESMGERGVYKHSSQLYNEQTKVPMIVYAPNLAPRRIADYVSTIDLGSTILNIVGLECPEDYVGVSLLPLMRGEPFTHPPIYGEERYKPREYPNLRPTEDPQTEIAKYMVITQDGYKLIYNRNFQGFELFDLKHDPKERKNLYDLMAEKAAEMKERLGRFIDIVSASRPWDADESKYALGKDENKDRDPIATEP